MKKNRINHLVLKARERIQSLRADNYLARWKDARSRWMILCKDGQERTTEEWIKTLPESLADQITQLLTAENPTSENLSK
jgi:hypothetical protein